MTIFETITHHTQETSCDHCGCPLYVGDQAIFTDEGVFCSRRCLTRWEARHLQEKTGRAGPHTQAAREKANGIHGKIQMKAADEYPRRTKEARP